MLSCGLLFTGMFIGWCDPVVAMVRDDLFKGERERTNNGQHYR